MPSNNIVVAITRRKWATEEARDAVEASEITQRYLRQNYDGVTEIDDSRLERPEQLLSSGLGCIVVPVQRWFFESYLNGLIRFAELGGRVFATYPSFWKDENGSNTIETRLSKLFGIVTEVRDRSVNGILNFRMSRESWLSKDIPSHLQTRENDSRWGWVITPPEAVLIGEWRISNARMYISKSEPRKHDSALVNKTATLFLVNKYATGGLFVYACFDYESLLNECYEMGNIVKNVIDYSPKSRLELNSSETSHASTSRSIFIVHGHDVGARDSAARFVEKLELRAIILQEQPNAGRTIIENFEAHSNVGFAVVLMTPDDVAAPVNDTKKAKLRARQNVIFELGYFVGKLGRGKVCVLHKGNVEIPSDYQGVLYIPMDSAGAWQMKLAKEIKNAGIEIDLNKAL